MKRDSHEFLNRKGAQVAINGNFFTPVGTTSSITANVVGLAASAGNVFSAFEPQPITASGTPNQGYGGVDEHRVLARTAKRCDFA